MGTIVSRAALFVVSLIAGALAGPGFISGMWAPFAGAAGGAIVCLLAYWVEAWIRKAAPLAVVGASAGVLLGLVGALLARGAFGLSDLPQAAELGFGAVFVYLGGIAGARGLKVTRVGGGKPGVASSSNPKILDTSAIIDGRIADMVELGFVGGPLVVPQFVLNEVQGIADSSDSVKRGRGRRGLAILEKLQDLDGVDTRITDRDFPQIKEVDRKLVTLAKSTGATVVTNDFNLTKVAELQGVRVLNINQLSHALRPVVLPGEEVQIAVQKPGKEPGQGVGYLEDGTMVVVEGGAARVGETVRVAVTSVLQTSAGRLIFAKPNGVSEGEVKEKRSVWRRRA